MDSKCRNRLAPCAHSSTVTLCDKFKRPNWSVLWMNCSKSGPQVACFRPRSAESNSPLKSAGEPPSQAAKPSLMPTTRPLASRTAVPLTSHVASVEEMGNYFDRKRRLQEQTIAGLLLKMNRQKVGNMVQQFIRWVTCVAGNDASSHAHFFGTC